MSKADFRKYLMPADAERIAIAKNQDPYDYGAKMLATEGAKALKAEWDRRLYEPFKGVTSNGNVIPDLFELEDQGFDPVPAVIAANEMLASLSADHRERVQHAVDATEWRAWYNPEIPFNDFGVRLENMPAPSRNMLLKLLKSCTSETGYTKVQQLLSANLYIGELYGLENVMNEWSFHFLMFGEPSATEPWGWSVYGHHVAFCCFIVGSQMVISPTFMGVEPNVIDRGQGNSFTLFTDEEQRGLALMQSLSTELQKRATIYEQMVDPNMPEDRFNFADQRHLGGAFRDNRIIPLEGVKASEFNPGQRNQLLALIETFFEHMPDGPRAARMRHVEQHLDETWWNWIGSHGDDDPFYYRIQSPVVMIEFDHHSGMWLTNEAPQKFHIHLITRIPNGNDYGRALLHRYQQA